MKSTVPKTFDVTYCIIGTNIKKNIIRVGCEEEDVIADILAELKVEDSSKDYAILSCVLNKDEENV